MYLPLFIEENETKDIPVFYGAISIYLKLRYPFLRNAPPWIDRLLNSGPLMKLAAGMAGSTRAKGLEEMTVSMLLGEQGLQKRELEKMVDWIAECCGKDTILHISRYFPMFKIDNLPTSQSKLESLYLVAKEKLNFVYLGNIKTPNGQNTDCPNCNQRLITRSGYNVHIDHLKKSGKCIKCNYPVVLS
jgi:hypothetical protein